MHGELVGVRQHATWVPGTVLWEYVDCGRRRALVRIEAPLGTVVRRLCWFDELLRGRPVLSLVAAQAAVPRPPE